jgi:hypothetical protein
LAATEEALVGQVRSARPRGARDDFRIDRWREPGIAAEGVALPDLDRRVGERLVSGSSEADAELQFDALAVLDSGTLMPSPIIPIPTGSPARNPPCPSPYWSAKMVRLEFEAVRSARADTAEGCG